MAEEKEPKPKPSKEKKGKKEEAEEEAEEEVHEPRAKPKLEPHLKKLLALRSAKNAARPRFRRQEWFRYRKFGDEWRKPQGGQSKLRRHFGYRWNLPSIGYRGPRAVRGLHPSGFQEGLVHNEHQPERLDPSQQAGRLPRASATSRRAAGERPTPRAWEPQGGPQRADAAENSMDPDYPGHASLSAGAPRHGADRHVDVPTVLRPVQGRHVQIEVPPGPAVARGRRDQGGTEVKQGPHYRVPFRRRREGRTDYRSRAKLLRSGKPRVVVRKTLNQTIIQFIVADAGGDRVVPTAQSLEPEERGWAAGTRNPPAAYPTGNLAGKRAAAKGVSAAILDLGLQRPSKGGRLLAALPGLLDAGVAVPHSPDVLPSKERVRGAHIGESIPMQFDAVKAKLEAP